MATLVVNGFDITTLSNDELFHRLKNLGASVGPIVESTRKVYERKLQRLLYEDAKESTEECPEATIATSANHAGILKSTIDIPRIRTGRRSVTILPTKTPEQPPQQQTPEERPLLEVDHARKSQSDECPSYFGSPTPRQALHTGATPTNTPPSAVFRKSSMHSTSLDSMTCRETVLNNNFEGQKINLAAAPLHKNNQWFVTVFEVFIISFLVIVGYVFYQEVMSFTQAEKEFMDSNAQNLQDI